MGASYSWFGHRGSDAIMMTSLDPHSLRASFIYGSVGGTTATDECSASLEKRCGREAVSSDDLEAHSEELIALGCCKEESSPSYVVPFRSTVPLEEWASDAGVVVCAASASLARVIADRRFLTEQAAEFGVSVPETVQIEPGWTYSRLRALLGAAFILKGVGGVSGRECFRVENARDFAAVLPRVEVGPIYAWRIVDGPSLNFHFCIGETSLSIFDPTVQRLGGSERLRPYRFLGNICKVGADIGSAALDGARREIVRLAELMREAGFRGVAGADVIVSDDAQYVVDVNPRFQGSSLLVDLNLAAAKMPRLVTEHLRAVSGGELQPVVAAPAEKPQGVGGQFFVLGSGDVVRGGRPIRNGVYLHDMGGLRYQGNFCAGGKLTDGLFLLLDLPGESVTLRPRSVLARVIHAPGVSSAQLSEVARCISDGRLR